MPKVLVTLGIVSDEGAALLAPTFDRAYPTDKTPCFGELLHALDLADWPMWVQRDCLHHQPADLPVFTMTD